MQREYLHVCSGAIGRFLCNGVCLYSVPNFRCCVVLLALTTVPFHASFTDACSLSHYRLSSRFVSSILGGRTDSDSASHLVKTTAADGTFAWLVFDCPGWSWYWSTVPSSLTLRHLGRTDCLTQTPERSRMDQLEPCIRSRGGKSHYSWDRRNKWQIGSPWVLIRVSLPVPITWEK